MKTCNVLASSFVVAAFFILSIAGAVSAFDDPELEHYMSENRRRWADEDHLVVAHNGVAFAEAPPAAEVAAAVDHEGELTRMRALEAEAAHRAHAFLDDLHALEDHVRRREAEARRPKEGGLRMKKGQE